MAPAAAGSILHHSAAGAATRSPQGQCSEPWAVCLKVSPHKAMGMLRLELKRWLEDGASPVMLATGLTSQQRTSACQLILELYGASVAAETVQQEDGIKALRITRAPQDSNSQKPGPSANISNTQTVSLKVNPSRTMSVLKQHLKRWWRSSSEVLLATGLTSVQRDTAHELIQKEYGASMIHETVQQEDGTKALRIVKAHKCIMAALLVMRAYNLPQDICSVLLAPMRDLWVANEEARAEHARQEAELRLLTCDGCDMTGDKKLMVEADWGELLCEACFMLISEMREMEEGCMMDDGCPCPECSLWLHDEDWSGSEDS